jgi:hypothetical protein
MRFKDDILLQILTLLVLWSLIIFLQDYETPEMTKIRRNLQDRLLENKHK